MSSHLKIKAVIFLFPMFLFGFVFSCEPSGENKASSSSLEENEVPEEIFFEPEKLPVIITYHLDSITTSEEVDNFKTRFPEDVRKLVFALNRMDPRYLGTRNVLIIPDTITGNYLDYSPFPKTLEMLEKIPKSILISRRVQAFGLYEGNKLVKWGPVSSGKESTPTPAGLFYGNYKAKRKVSTVNDSWILPYYFNFMNFDGVGVHQYAMPGYPASHACVRLYMDDAMVIYKWAQSWKLDSSGREIVKNGTPFMVFGDYDFEKPVPWLDLANNPNANFLTAGEMETLKDYVDSYFKDKRNFDPAIFPEEQLAITSGGGLETLR